MLGDECNKDDEYDEKAQNRLVSNLLKQVENYCTNFQKQKAIAQKYKKALEENGFEVEKIEIKSKKNVKDF